MVVRSRPASEAGVAVSSETVASDAALSADESETNDSASVSVLYEVVADDRLCAGEAHQGADGESGTAAAAEVDDWRRCERDERLWCRFGLDLVWGGPASGEGQRGSSGQR